MKSELLKQLREKGWRAVIRSMGPPEHECRWEDCGDGRRMCEVCGEYEKPEDAIREGDGEKLD